MEIQERIGRAFVGSYAINAVGQVSNIAFSLLVFKYLSLNDVGLYSWAFAIGSFYSLFLDWGQMQILPRGFARQEYSANRIWKYLGFTRTPVIIFSLTLLFFIYRTGYLNNREVAALFLVGLFQVLQIFQSISLSYLRASDKQLVANFFQSLLSISRLAVLLIFILFNSITTIPLLIGLVATSFFISAIILFFLILNIEQKVVENFKEQQGISSLRNAGFIIFFLSFFGLLQNRLDWLLITHWLSNIDLANYSLANKVYEIILSFLGIGYSIIFVWLCREKSEDQNFQISVLSRFTLILGTLISLTVVLAGPETLSLLWGNKYAGTENLIRLLAGLAGLSSIISLYYQVIISEKKEGFLVPITLLCTGLQIGFDFWAIPKFGIWGAGLGMAILVLSTAASYYLLVKKLFVVHLFHPMKVYLFFVTTCFIAFVLLWLPNILLRVLLLLISVLSIGWSLLFLKDEQSRLMQLIRSRIFVLYGRVEEGN